MEAKHNVKEKKINIKRNQHVIKEYAFDLQNVPLQSNVQSSPEMCSQRTSIIIYFLPYLLDGLLVAEGNKQPGHIN